MGRLATETRQPATACSLHSRGSREPSPGACSHASGSLPWAWRMGRRTDPLKVTVHGRPPMGTQQLLRDHFQLQGLSKRTLGKRTGSAEWQVCPPRGWEEVIRVWIRVVSCRGPVVGTNVRVLRFTACVHMDVCVCPPKMHLVLACVNADISEDWPSSRSCYCSMIGSVMLKCLCRWEAQVRIILGARTEPAWRQRPPPSLHLPQREPGVLQRRARGWKSSKKNISKLSFNL